MIHGIDHLVILVQNLAQAVANYERLGFTVTPGGEHVGGETHNALICFADESYLELLAFSDLEATSSHRWRPQLAHGEGLIDFALASSDVAADLALARGRGTKMEGPVEGGRVRHDGQAIAWRMAVPVAAPGSLPFLIEDVTDRVLRVPEEGRTHTNGVLGIESVMVAVRDIEAASAQYSAMLGVEATAPEYEAEIDVLQLRLEVGATALILAQPASAQSPLTAYLAGRGESIFAATLVSEIRSGVAMNPALLCGAHLSLAIP